MKQCLRCQNSLSDYNKELFCNSCQEDPEAEFPAHVIIEKDGTVFLDWWSEKEDLQQMSEAGQQQIPVLIAVQDHIALTKILELIQEKEEETEGQFPCSGIITALIPKIIKKALEKK